MHRWKQWLSEPGPDGHLVQLYQDESFFGDAVAHFAAEGITRNEAVILTATRPHWENISDRLVSRGLEPGSLIERGRLTVLDAEGTLLKLMAGDLPDETVFAKLARSTLERVRSAAGTSRVRWWGEMVNVLYGRGNFRGSIRLEELFGRLGREEQIAIFCSFRMHPFDPGLYDGTIQDVCRTHGHLIPAPDDSGHRDCVDRAFAEVFGPLDLASLNLLIGGSRWSGIEMPASQALLLWLKDAAPDKATMVLQRARALEAECGKGRP